MSELIKCNCCKRKVSDESKHCIYCGEPINEKEYTILLDFILNGESINTPRFREPLEKLKLLKEVGKVEVYNTIYRVDDIISSGNNEVVYVIVSLED